jgi:hypothetical protein
MQRNISCLLIYRLLSWTQSIDHNQLATASLCQGRVSPGKECLKSCTMALWRERENENDSHSLSFFLNVYVHMYIYTYVHTHTVHTAPKHVFVPIPERMYKRGTCLTIVTAPSLTVTYNFAF